MSMDGFHCDCDSLILAKVRPPCPIHGIKGKNEWDALERGVALAARYRDALEFIEQRALVMESGETVDPVEISRFARAALKSSTETGDG